jgi:multiple sugar transport system permease protein
VSSQVVIATPQREGSPEGTRPSPSRGRRLRQSDFAPYILLAPSLALLAVLVLWPMARAFLLAFQDPAGSWTSANFHKMETDYQFWSSVKNTLLIMVTIIPLEFALALCMAMIVQSGIRGRQLFLYIWTIPLAISDLAAGLVWLSIFTQNGYLNSVLVDTHLTNSGFDFLSYEHPVTMFMAVVVAEVWRSTSLVMLILLGGLQGIPKEYGEAADVFGASFWQRLRHVTLPLLKPSIRVALILRTIFAFQVFAVVIALTGQSLPVLGAQVYYWYNSYQNPNVAASIAVVILALSVMSTALYLGILRSRAEVTGGVR